MFNPDELIKYLEFTPTGDNAQQFQFQFVDSALKIIHSNEIAKHKFNQFNVSSLLSLGMIIHIIKIYSAEKNYSCHFNFPDPSFDGPNWLTCTFEILPTIGVKTSVTHNLQLDYISKRYTNRGPYKKDNFNFNEIKNKYSNSIAFNPKLSPSLYKSIYKIETMIFDDIDAFRDIEKWVRYTKKTLLATKTGMSAKSLCLDFFNAFLFKLFRKNSFLNVILNPYLKILTWFKVNIFYRCSSGFGLCYLNSKNNNDIITMGENIMNCWLDLTIKGYTLQPISAPTLLPFIQRNRSGVFNLKYTNDLANLNEIISREFHTSGEIIWMFRFGKAIDNSLNDKITRSKAA